MNDEPEVQSDEEVVLLNGDPVPAAMDFPIDPPPEIGQVKAMYSTCTVGKPLRSIKKRLAIIGLVFLLAAVPVMVVVGMTSPDSHPWVLGATLGVLLGLLSVPFTFYFTRGSSWLAYVGEIGLVKYKLGAERTQVKTTELFEFVNAVDLYTHTVNSNVNGVYAGTTYNYEWRDADDKRVFKLSGSHSSKKGTPKASSPYYIAAAGEMMWTAFLGDAINDELKDQGAIHFKVNKKDWVRVGPGFLEFFFKGKTSRLAVDEIKDLRVGGGHFSIKSQDAGWLGGKGKYGFDYAKMANARLFLMCLEQLCGYSFE